MKAFDRFRSAFRATLFGPSEHLTECSRYVCALNNQVQVTLYRGDHRFVITLERSDAIRLGEELLFEAKAAPSHYMTPEQAQYTYEEVR